MRETQFHRLAYQNRLVLANTGGETFVRLFKTLDAIFQIGH